MLIILLQLKKVRQILNHLNLKLVVESEVLLAKVYLVKVTLKIDQRNVCDWFCAKN